MPTLYLDEDVSVDLGELLAEQGLFVTSTSVERRMGASDPHQLVFAADRNLTIVTHNGRDYRLLHEAWLLWARRWGVRPSHGGILVLQPIHRFPLVELADAVASLLTDPGTVLETTLYDWKRPTGWVKFPD